jgi:hypothetical protein
MSFCVKLVGYRLEFVPIGGQLEHAPDGSGFVIIGPQFFFASLCAVANGSIASGVTA